MLRFAVGMELPDEVWRLLSVVADDVAWAVSGGAELNMRLWVCNADLSNRDPVPNKVNGDCSVCLAGASMLRRLRGDADSGGMHPGDVIHAGEPAGHPFHFLDGLREMGRFHIYRGPHEGRLLVLCVENEVCGGDIHITAMVPGRNLPNEQDLVGRLRRASEFLEQVAPGLCVSHFSCILPMLNPRVRPVSREGQ